MQLRRRNSGHSCRNQMRHLGLGGRSGGTLAVDFGDGRSAGSSSAPEQGLHQLIINCTGRKNDPGCAIGHSAMGRVSTRTQWLIVAACVVLCPVFVLLTPCLLGWPLLRRLWPRPKVAPGSVLAPARRAGAAPLG